MSFFGKLVIITGAGSGLGREIALAFAEQKADLCLIDKNGETLQETSELCKAVSDTKVYLIKIDVTSDEDVRHAVEESVQEFGKIDVLVNCAGVIELKSILDTNIIPCFDRVMDVNLRSVVVITHYALPFLIESKGNIINVTSSGFRKVIPNKLAYLVSKAGLSHFTKCVALELAPKGVRVNAVASGPSRTNLLLNAGLSKEEENAMFEIFRWRNPTKRLTPPKEIADLITFLASEKARSITGADYIIDDGFSFAQVVD